MEQEINPEFVDVIDEVTDFVMANRSGWEGKYGGMVVITLPPGEDMAVGNVLGFVPDSAEDMDGWDVSAACLVSFIAGLLLMGFDREAIEKAVVTAEAMATVSTMVDATNSPEN
jgi:hypothetical protein